MPEGAAEEGQVARRLKVERAIGRRPEPAFGARGRLEGRRIAARDEGSALLLDVTLALVGLRPAVVLEGDVDDTQAGEAGRGTHESIRDRHDHIEARGSLTNQRRVVEPPHLPVAVPLPWAELGKDPRVLDPCDARGTLAARLVNQIEPAGLLHAHKHAAIARTAPIQSHAQAAQRVHARNTAAALRPLRALRRIHHLHRLGVAPEKRRERLHNVAIGGGGVLSLRPRCPQIVRQRAALRPPTTDPQIPRPGLQPGRLLGDVG
jgi:hypothetical protein